MVAGIGFALVFAQGLARAGDTCTTPFPGVQHLHRTTSKPLNIHALVIDHRTNKTAAVAASPAHSPIQRPAVPSSIHDPSTNMVGTPIT
jgi:hypothetical protein